MTFNCLSKNRFISRAAIFFFAVSLCLNAQEGIITPGKPKRGNRHPAFAKVVDDPSLPRVLIIGDSISIGYTAPVRAQLEGEANVHRIRANAGNSGRAIGKLDHWLDPKNGAWDVIHFNFGLWDLCYRSPQSKNQGNRDKVHGKLTHDIPTYSKNLETIVKRLKQTGATLIFAMTTPVPKGEAGRKLGDDLLYNEAARKVMQKHGVIINDLYALAAPSMKQWGKAPGDVHFKPQGYVALGKQTAEVIRRTLPKKTK
ncbi:SGNH/GDSL hydrolase family protein [Verrucomicrobiaceae bacterium N1E253]|uniref:SGNH/GDSL hydrolase family protein n=1 Tax=Oceaniferula marina TaxID=2748318 RepID=A0A851G8V5_9BACT|nr:SGNH/GDSL hydrolase family protein [Oceaniferula marina]NWK54148.1 SGNH/GDSL hydrolase family protein [Oceaniferula marina]